MRTGNSSAADPGLLHIVEGGLDEPQVIQLLEHHVRQARAETARGSAHALDLSGLKAPDITFFSVWSGPDALGVGAFRRFTDGTGEVKSMYTAEAARRRGVGQAMLRHLVASARAAGLSKLFLETGSWPYFDAARRFYAAEGFTECAPFGDYRLDPNSVFMAMVL